MRTLTRIATAPLWALILLGLFGLLALVGVGAAIGWALGDD